MKSCANCKHYLLGKHYVDIVHSCVIPDKESDPVTGLKMQSSRECYYMRGGRGGCGPEAALFVHRHWFWRIFT